MSISVEYGYRGYMIIMLLRWEFCVTHMQNDSLALPTLYLSFIGGRGEGKGSGVVSINNLC